MATKLRAKVAKFQKADGLKVTGKFDSVTRAEITRARKGKPSQAPKARTARRKARATAAANDPAAVTAPLTAGTLKSEVDAAVRQKFGSTEQGLNDQVRVSQFQQDRRIPDYYADYLRAVQNAQYGSAGAYDQAGQQIQGQIAGDTASSGSAEAQQAAASRKTLLQSQANSTAQQKASSQTYFGGLQANSVLAKAQAADRESSRRDSLVKQLAQTKQDEGDYATSLTRDARTSERNYDLQRQTLGLNTAKAENDVTTKTLTAKLNAQAKKAANSLARDSLDERTRHDKAGEATAADRVAAAKEKAAAAAAKKDKHKGPTHAAKVTASNNLTKAKSYISGAQGSRSLLYNFLVQKKSIPADLARAAVELEFDGGVNNAVRSQLYKRYRIKLPHVDDNSRKAAHSRRGTLSAGIDLAGSLPGKKPKP